MKQYAKKVLVSVLTLLMVLGGATSAFAHGNDGDHGSSKGKDKHELKMQFKDIDDGVGWARKNIASLAARRVFDGYDDGTFQPRKPISRIEAIIASVRLMGLRDQAESEAEMTAHLNFKDADKIEQKYPNAVGYIAVALENDLFNETDTEVQPDKAASRIWATTLLVKAMKLDAEAKAKMNTELTFKDAKQIPAGSVGYVAVALENHIIYGYENNTFRPNQPVTRAELAALLDRTGNALPDQGSGAVRGTISVAVNANLFTIISHGQSLQLPLDPNAFIYRDGEKVAASELAVGDEIIARSYNDAIIFIEVTKMASTDTPPVTPPTEFTVDGTINAISYDLNNKITSIAINQTVNGSTLVTIYNVSPTVTITGVTTPLAVNQAVELKGNDTLVTSITAPPAAPPTTFTVDGTINAVSYDLNNKITSIALNQVVNGSSQVTIYNVSPTVTITGVTTPLTVNQAVELTGSDQLVTSITAPPVVPVAFTEDGTINAISYDLNNKITSIAINQVVSGAVQVKIYNVSPTVTITGVTTPLAVNQSVEIAGTDTLVTSITAPAATSSAAFTVDGTINAIILDTNNKITTIALNQVVNGATQVNIYFVAPTAVITGTTDPLAVNQAVELKGSHQMVTSIEAK